MSTLHWYQRKFFKALISERQVRFGFVVTSLVLIFALIGPVLVPFEPTALVIGTILFVAALYILYARTRKAAA